MIRLFRREQAENNCRLNNRGINLGALGRVDTYRAMLAEANFFARQGAVVQVERCSIS